jgi:CheY-like chemotaxis protein
MESPTSTPATVPANEGARLALLRGLGLLDTPPDPEFDAIVAEAVRLTGYDTGLITLMGADRCWFKATAGVLAAPGMPREIPRNQTYCQHALGSSGFFVVSDGLLDSRFCNLTSVTGPGGFRAYAGIQLILPEGLSVGSFCVMNRSPRSPTADDHATLRRLAERVLQLIAARRRDEHPPAVTSRSTLLVVDDDESIRGFLAAVFNKRGLRTLIARDGAEALQLYRENSLHIAAVLTDFVMPGVDGLTLVRTLRAEPHPPVCMVMSGRLGAVDRRDFAAAGVQLVIDKPFGLVELDVVIEIVGAAASA